MKLRINPFVIVDLKNIKEYIEEDNIDSAKKVVEEIYDQFEKLQMFPNMGVDLSKKVSFKTEYKYVLHGNYVILYKVKDDYVEIYRIVNRYQDITRVFGELE